MTDAVTHPRLPRGGRVSAWWAKAWLRAVEEAAYGEGDLRAGRALARGGAVGPVAVSRGRAVAGVEGRPGSDSATVTVTVPALEEWAVEVVVDLVAAESGRVGALLSGDLPIGLVEAADEAGVELLPYGTELGSSCTCEAWVDPCPHAVAVLTRLALQVQADPFVLLHLRGLPREELLARLHAHRGAAARAPAGAARPHLARDEQGERETPSPGDAHQVRHADEARCPYEVTDGGPDDVDLDVAVEAAQAAARLLAED